MTAKVSRVEQIKENSRNLRGDLSAQLDNQLPHIDKDNIQILKSHGIYQQDDRDIRKQKGMDKEYSFMVRSRIAGGGLFASQYLAHDKISDTYGNSTLRLTTRQTIQLHGVIKGDLRKALSNLNDQMITAIGACGDIVRNIMCCPAPATDTAHQQIMELTRQLSDHLLPRSRAYHEIWIDGEKQISTHEVDPEHEPLYGKNYLPRKFKIGVAWPGDNCVDVFTHDIGLIAVPDSLDRLAGFTVVAGGGMGMNHKKKETFPRLADPLAYVPLEKTRDVVTAIVAIQRDYGDRENRKHARFKYLVDEWGISKLCEELERRLGYTLDPPGEIDEMRPNLHLGWNRQSDDLWYLGLSVQNGRIADTPDVQMKTGLREIIKAYQTGVRLTPNQDILLTHIREADRHGIEEIIKKRNIPHAGTLTAVRKYSMACPALPTCGLAITEAERVFPDVIRKFEKELDDLGLGREEISIRMTGCPNGCSRPYVADIGIVGHSLNKYDIFIGGDIAGRRLNRLYKDLVELDQLVPAVQPLLKHFGENRINGELFSDFMARTNAFEEFTTTSVEEVEV